MSDKDKKPIPIKERMLKLGKEMEFASEDEIAAYDRKHHGAAMIKDACDRAKEHISKQPQPHEQMVFSFMPSPMTRTSPFFPMSKRQMKDRPTEKLSWETSWGKITVSGQRLSVHDETVLLSLLALVKKHRAEAFSTTQYELCQIANVSLGKNTYNAIWNAIDRLTKTNISIEIWKGKGRDRKPVEQMTGNILAWAKRNNKTGKLDILMNPYFLRMYADGLLTGLDLGFRAGLKGDTAKALYRFLQGQKPFTKKGKYEIHLLKLCTGINLTIEGVEGRRLRSQVSGGLKELRKQGYLIRWQIDRQDIVSMQKAEKKALLDN